VIYKTFKEWKDGNWLEDGEPRKKAYTKDELLLVEMGWKYGFDAGKAQIKELSDEEINAVYHEVWNSNKWSDVEGIDIEKFARAILKKASEK